MEKVTVFKSEHPESAWINQRFKNGIFAVVISYNIHHLDNGLTLIHHADHNTNLCVTNLLYNVGARDENPDKTEIGRAHV